MNLQKNTILYKPFFWLFLLFLGLHLALFNINSAEWGDSYRILRAAESLKEGFYPDDEKRPPLFAFMLSLRPRFIDPINFGRVTVFVLSIATFYLFFRLLEFYFNDNLSKIIASLFFIFNNIYLYWSIRIMTDVLFTFFVVLIFYLYKKWEHSFKLLALFFLGVLVGFSILSRFEGYVLLTACGIGLLLSRPLKSFKSNVLKALVFAAGSALVVLPYFIYKNPFSSSYLEEPTGRAYDLKMVLIFLVSLSYVLGVTQFLGVVFSAFRRLFTWAKENLSISVFLVLDLILIFFWPAAIPRLFLPIIPILIIVFTVSLKDYFSQRNALVKVFTINIFLLAFYVVAQYFYKLQFLVLIKPIFIANSGLILIGTYLLFKKKLKSYITVSLLSLLISSASVIYIHKDIFISVKSAAIFASENLSGNIAYNDVSSVSDWYINYQNKNPTRRGFYYNTEKKAYLDHNKLLSEQIDYLLITNEHNTTMTLDLNKRPYLKEIAKFSYNVNGREFTSRVVEVL